MIQDEEFWKKAMAYLWEQVPERYTIDEAKEKAVRWLSQNSNCYGDDDLYRIKEMMVAILFDKWR